MFNLTKTRYLNFLASLLLVMIFLPIFTNNLPRYIGSIHFIALLWFLSLIFIDDYVLKNKFFIGTVVLLITIQYVLYNTIWSYIGSDPLVQHFSEHYAIILALSLFTYFNKSEKSRAYLGKLTYWLIGCIVITCFTTIYITSINPMYVRDIVGSAVSGITQTEITWFKRYGAGAYGFATLLVIILPGIIYLRKIDYLKIKTTFFLIILIVFTLIRMQIMANILTASLLIIISFFGVKKLKRSIPIVLFILIIALIIPPYIYSNFFGYLSQYFDSNSNVYFKLNDLGLFFDTIGSSINTATSSRFDRYPLLLQALNENIFFGAFSVTSSHYWASGFHLYWMYKLGSFGIIGLMLYISIHYKYVKINLKIFDETYMFYFLVSVVGFVLLGLMKNIAGRNAWVGYFVLLNGIYYIPKNKKRFFNFKKRGINYVQ